MSRLGFVYVLVNRGMPEIYKVGCTERSPHARAADLSRASGVPGPFEVLCYVEVPDFGRVERDLHRWLQAHRFNASREFFDGGLELAVRLLYWHRASLSFCAPAASGGVIDRALFLARIGLPWLVDMADTRDPWANYPPEVSGRALGEPSLVPN